MKILWIFMSIASMFVTSKSFKKPSNFIYHPQNHYLSGVFRPVDKETDLEITHNNSLFSSLDTKIFLQIGSNPRHIGTTDAGYHWFDGDGMIHGVFFDKNKIRYTNRWVQTKRLKAEKKWGQKMFLYFGELRGFRGFMQIIKWSIYQYFKLLPGSKGTANTALIEWNNRLYALHEGDLPYEINIHPNHANISTIEQHLWSCNFKSVTAHPKIDLKRNEIYFYGYNNYDFSKGIFFHNVMDSNMNIKKQTNFSLLNNGMVHDIAMTENHMIIPDLPLKYNFSQIFKNKLPLVFDLNGTTRFGVFAKDNSNTIDWYYLHENVFIFHFCKSFETINSFTTYACSMESLDMMDFVHLENKEYKIRGNLRLHKIILDKKTKKAVLQKNMFIENLGLYFPEVDFPYNLDFPVEETTKSDPYVYCSIFDATTGRIRGNLRVNSIDFTRRKPDVFILEDQFINSEQQIVYVDKKPLLISFSYDNLERSFVSLVDIPNKKCHSLKISDSIRIPPGFHSYIGNYKTFLSYNNIHV